MVQEAFVLPQELSLGAILGRNTVAAEHKPTEAELICLGLLYVNRVLLLKYCNVSSRVNETFQKY